MQQIADWLGKLGMSEYAQRFAENDIDFAILRDLTDQVKLLATCRNRRIVGVESANYPALGYQKIFPRVVR
jgi:hypothetical protein